PEQSSADGERSPAHGRDRRIRSRKTSWSERLTMRTASVRVPSLPGSSTTACSQALSFGEISIANPAGTDARNPGSPENRRAAAAKERTRQMIVIQIVWGGWGRIHGEHPLQNAWWRSLKEVAAAASGIEV